MSDICHVLHHHSALTCSAVTGNQMIMLDHTKGSSRADSVFKGLYAITTAGVRDH